MVNIQNLNHKTLTCVVYQRMTVIVSDLIFVFACHKLTQLNKNRLSVFVLTYLNLGLFLVDNIHF